MTKRAELARTAAALRELDPAASTDLTVEERQRAEAMLERIVASSGGDPVPAAAVPRRRRRRWVLAPVGLLAAGAVGVPVLLGGGSAFGSWTGDPTPLSQSAAVEAAATCRAGLDMREPDPRVVLGERRGGWTYVLLSGSGAEGACLMPDDQVGARDPRQGIGFFGSYDTDPPAPPTPAPGSIVETEITTGTVSVPRLLPIGKVDDLFTWVTGFAGSDVSGVTVHPPVGPDVQATLQGGRFSAWWPAGEARGDNPGMTGASTYTVTLTDGTTRRVG